MHTETVHWLMDHAAAPIRYRIAQGILHDAKSAKALEADLLAHPAVHLWLQHLKPHTPPQHRWMEHGSFDFCLENAILKAVQLGLHGGLPQLDHAVGYYLAKMLKAAELPLKRKDFITAILTANLLSLAGVEDDRIRRYILASLDEMHSFIQIKPMQLYLDGAEAGRLPGVPKCWKQRPFIRPEIVDAYGFAFPLLYDIVGMHALYRLGDPAVNRKIDDIIRFISTDAFHHSVADGYGIVITGKRSYYAMGWDPKYPGWFSVADYMKTGSVPQLLFYALHASRYPAARETKWFAELLACLEAYRTPKGRYAFPAAFLPEMQGYAVMGRHLSFGENRRNRNWREIESTFYMMLIQQEPTVSAS